MHANEITSVSFAGRLPVKVETSPSPPRVPQVLYAEKVGQYAVCRDDNSDWFVMNKDGDTVHEGSVANCYRWAREASEVGHA